MMPQLYMLNQIKYVWLCTDQQLFLIQVRPFDADTIGAAALVETFRESRTR